LITEHRGDDNMAARPLKPVRRPSGQHPFGCGDRRLGLTRSLEQFGKNGIARVRLRIQWLPRKTSQAV
jgi:hypothetical protein